MYQEKWRLVATLETGVPTPVRILTRDMIRDYEKLVRVKLDTEADPEDPSIFDGRTKVKVLSSCDLDSDAIVSLQRNNWISGDIIEAFTKSLFEVSVHKDSKRFCFLTPFSYVHAEKWSRKKDRKASIQLHGYLRGIALHDIDSIILPLHADKNHWLVCFIDTTTREVVVVDPFSPHSPHFASAKLRNVVKETLSLFSSEYDRNMQFGTSGE